MIHFRCKIFTIITVSAISLFLASCKAEKPVKTEKQQIQNQLQSETNSFFSDEVLESDPAPDNEVFCPDATTAEMNDLNHPQLVRGSVVAPRIQASFGIPFINQAHAVPIPGEFPVPGVKVKLMEGFSEPKIVSETTTDALGRFCLKLSWTNTFDGTQYLETKVGENTLRRLSPSQKVAIISTQSEAVFRLYVTNLGQTKLSKTASKRSMAINLQTIADSQVDTFKPVSAQSTIEKTVALILENLRNDQRVQESLGLK